MAVSPGEEFVLLLEASSSAPTKSYDSVFEVLEKIITGERESQTSTGTDSQVGSTSVASQSSDRLPDDDIRKILGYNDFTKLSQDALERSSENKRVPHDLWRKEVFSLCLQLRTQLQRYQYASIIERISGRCMDRWSRLFSRRVLLQVSGSYEMQLAKTSHYGTESIKEKEVYISVLAGENDLVEDKKEPKLIPPQVTQMPRVLISTEEDELLLLTSHSCVQNIDVNYKQW